MIRLLYIVTKSEPRRKLIQVKRLGHQNNAHTCIAHNVNKPIIHVQLQDHNNTEISNTFLCSQICTSHVNKYQYTTEYT